MVAYLVAAAVAMLAAVGAAEHPKLPYWRRWNRAAVRRYFVPVYLLHAVAGVAVTALGYHWNQYFLDSGAAKDVANGVVYGGIAALLLRFDALPFVGDMLGPGRTLFKRWLDRMESTLDQSTERAIPRKLGQLHGREVARGAWRLFLRYDREEVERVEDLADVSDLLNEWVELACAAWDGSDGYRRSEIIAGQEQLRWFCEQRVIRNCDSTIHFGDVPPPPLMP